MFATHHASNIYAEEETIVSFRWLYVLVELLNACISNIIARAGSDHKQSIELYLYCVLSMY